MFKIHLKIQWMDKKCSKFNWNSINWLINVENSLKNSMQLFKMFQIHYFDRS